MKVKDRLEMYRNTLDNVKQEEFAKMAGVPVDTYKRLNNPNYDTLQRFLNAFTNLSAEWLMRGEGSMLITKNSSDVYNIDAPVNAIHVAGDANASFESTKRIHELNEKINYLNAELQIAKAESGSRQELVETYKSLLNSRERDLYDANKQILQLTKMLYEHRSTH